MDQIDEHNVLRPGFADLVMGHGQLVDGMGPPIFDDDDMDDDDEYSDEDDEDEIHYSAGINGKLPCQYNRFNLTGYRRGRLGTHRFHSSTSSLPTKTPCIFDS